jgi:hypothetical protein
MNKVFFLVLVIFVLTACTKQKPVIPIEPEKPEMLYHDLQNVQVNDGQSKSIDLK